MLEDAPKKYSKSVQQMVLTELCKPNERSETAKKRHLSPDYSRTKVSLQIKHIIRSMLEALN